jgi:predicted AlkP superfamily phosphohydrolase/phosphomutase/tetratricopeptide (TPR) repeat protein
MKKKKVLVIGWDAADWQIINPLMEKGLMPTLKSFLDEAAYGNISTLDPPYSPMLWTSIATGKQAYDHGVLGFTELLPDGSGIRPISSHSRKVKAIWNILNQEGYKSNVVSWWPSNPVDNINGVMVSNFYQHAKTKYNEPWPLLEGTVNDDALKDILAELRVHPGELTEAHLAPFIPNLKNLNIEEDKTLFATIKILAHAASVHNATTYLMEQTEWDFMAVYHDAIDHICHLAMKYRAPQLAGISDVDFENYKLLVDSMYRFHDMMLEHTLALVDEDTYVVLVSDHGFKSDHSRMVKVPLGPATPAIEHRPYGILAIKGPGIKKGEKIFGSTVLDVTPTLLHIMGLPVAKDMAGNVLSGAFTDFKIPEYIDSWEAVEGNHGMIKQSAKSDPEAEQRAMQQLIDLGYVDKKEESLEMRIKVTRRETQMNLARTYIHAGFKRKAIPVLEDVVAEFPHKYSELLLLSLYAELGELSKAESLLKTCKEKYPKSSNLAFSEAMIAWQKGQKRNATTLFNALMDHNPTPELYLQIGKAYNGAGHHEEAKSVLEEGLRLDPDDAFLNHQLGVSMLKLGAYEPALEQFFKVIEIHYYFPKAHHFIGEALYRMGMYQNAAEAWELTTTMAPKDAETRKWLIKVYKEHLNKPEQAKYHEAFLPDPAKEIVIVSGLPRSGTSMMMRMLKNAGLNLLVDEKRTADDNNPHGYFEFQPVMNLANDATWMPLAEGKAVKVIAQLLPYLPAKHRYKIIFMNREISEVLISQQIMLGKTREQAIMNYPFKLAQTYYNQLERIRKWIDDQPDVDFLEISYADAHSHTKEIAVKVAAFLDRDLPVDKMVTAVDNKLYRNQST